jgi:hypothetical protein
MRPLPSAWSAGGWRVPPVVVDLARTARPGYSHTLFSCGGDGAYRLLALPGWGGDNFWIRAGSPGLPPPQHVVETRQ